jgi:hypothetical protein
MKRQHTLRFRVSDDEAAEAKQLAKDAGLNDSDFLRRGLELAKAAVREDVAEAAAEEARREQESIRRQVKGLPAEPQTPAEHRAAQLAERPVTPVGTDERDESQPWLWSRRERASSGAPGAFTYYSPRPEQLSANARRARSFMQFGSNRPSPANEPGRLPPIGWQIARERWLENRED